MADLTSLRQGYGGPPPLRAKAEGPPYMRKAGGPEGPPYM